LQFRTIRNLSTASLNHGDAVTNSTPAAVPQTTVPEALAETILARLKQDRHLIALQEQGYEIGITCHADGIVASATAVDRALPSLSTRMRVGEWWDPKELEETEWAERLARALAVALCTAERRCTPGVRTRYRPGAPYPGRLRLRGPDWSQRAGG
jgi:hypothetical protein